MSYQTQTVPVQPPSRPAPPEPNTSSFWLTSPSHAHLITPIPDVHFLPSPPSLAAHDAAPLTPDDGTSGLAAVTSTLRRLFLDRVPDQVAAYRDAAASASTSGAADVLLVDLAAHGAHCFRELAGIPYATLGINPLVTLDPACPPWGTGWAPPATFLGRWVNALAHAVARRLLYPRLTAALNAHRAALGLPPLPASGFYDAARSDLLHIMPTTPAFEFPRDFHPSVKFVGPLLPLFEDEAVPPWWDEMLAHPRERVVHVTQGTYATDAGNLIGPTLSALRDRDELLVIVTTPDHEKVLPAGSLPPNARAASFVPHAKLLPHVGVMVTNAGYNGVLAALSCGVPMVCAGRSEDKADVSSRVAWSGAGIDLGTDAPGERALRDAVDRVLGEDKYRRAAERVRDDFARHDGPNEAVDALEEIVARCRR